MQIHEEHSQPNLIGEHRTHPERVERDDQAKRRDNQAYGRPLPIPDGI